MSKSEGKIKVVQIASSGGLGGAERHIFGLLSNLDRDKFELFLITPPGYLSTEAKKLAGVEVINVRLGSKFDFGSLREMKIAIGKIQSSSNPFGPIIIHTHGPRAGLIGRMAIPKGAVSVYTEHIWTADYHLENKINEFIQLWGLKRLNYKSDLIIAPSNAVGDFIIKNNIAPKNRLKVIPNGIEIKNAKLPKKIESKYHHSQIIGSAGSLNHLKGFNYLIEAMGEVVKSYPHATLEIAGEGEERAEFLKLISDLKLKKHVTLLGQIEDLPRVMKKWDIFALASITETFGMAILEAMLLGLPVVATRVGGIPEVVVDKKSGILVPPKSPKALAEAIISLIARPAYAAKISSNGKERVKEFDWREIIKVFEKQYLELTSKT